MRHRTRALLGFAGATSLPTALAGVAGVAALLAAVARFAPVPANVKCAA